MTIWWTVLILGKLLAAPVYIIYRCRYDTEANDAHA
jgi:hypothetical protein